jgi:hypothetical protein
VHSVLCCTDQAWIRRPFVRSRFLAYVAVCRATARHTVMKETKYKKYTKEEKERKLTESKRLLIVAASAEGALDESLDNLEGHSDEDIYRLAAQISRREFKAWYDRGRCLVELRRRSGICLQGGNGKKDDAGEGYTHLTKEFARRMNMDPRSLYKDIELIVFFGLGKENPPAFRREYYRQARAAFPEDLPSALRALEEAEARGAKRGGYPAAQFRRDLEARRAGGASRPAAEAGEGDADLPARPAPLEGVELTAEDRDNLDWIRVREKVSATRAIGKALYFYRAVREAELRSAA